MKNFNIRTKLAVWYTFMLMLFLAAGFVSVYQIIKKELMRQNTGDMHKDSAVIADEVGYNSYRESYEFDFDDASAEMLTGGIIYTLYSGDGIWLDGRSSAWIDALEHIEGEIRHIHYDGAEWLLMDRAVYDDGEYIGYARILLPMEQTNSVLNNILRVGVMSVIPCLVLSWLGGLVIAGRALAPVKKITDAAESLEQGNLSRRLDADGTDDEVGRLSKMFNRMAESLENSFEREKQFSSDASHELRSPLSVVIAHSESALETDELETYRSSMQAINLRGRQMQALLSRLLMMARGNEQLELVDFDLSAFVEDIAGEAAAKGAEKNIKVELSLEKGINYTADQALFVHMLVNITDNALKYTPSGANIKITLSKKDDGLEIAVYNEGREISEDELPKIFERFYRADKARSAGEGSGLGLPIAKRVAELHGGSIRAESSDSVTVFFMTFPCPPNTQLK